MNLNLKRNNAKKYPVGNDMLTKKDIAVRFNLYICEVRYLINMSYKNKTNIAQEIENKKHRDETKKRYCYSGKMLTLSEISKASGINRKTLYLWGGKTCNIEPIIERHIEKIKCSAPSKESSKKLLSMHNRKCKSIDKGFAITAARTSY